MARRGISDESAPTPVPWSFAADPARAAAGQGAASAAAHPLPPPLADPLAEAIAVVAAGNGAGAAPDARAAAEQAFGRLYDATLPRVYAVARRFCSDAGLAEEVVEDVYLQVWRDAGRFDARRGPPLAWLLVLARSRGLDALRRRDEAVVTADPEALRGEGADGGLDGGPHDDPLDLLTATRRSEAVHAALRTLAPRDRQLLALAFFRGLAHAEIATATGLPLGTVKASIRRALLALRPQILPWGTGMPEPPDASATSSASSSLPAAGVRDV